VRIDVGGPTTVVWPDQCAPELAGAAVGNNLTVMTNQLFEAALGIMSPWFVEAVDFDAGQRQLTVRVDFAPGTRFAHPKVSGEHPVHDTQIKRLRHLNFFQHECRLEVRVPRVRLPDGKVALVELDWVGKLSGFTLLFEALVLLLAQQMPFAAVARIVGETWHRVHAICAHYVDLAVERTDLSAVDTVAIDETSYRRGHNYLTLAADADTRRVVFVTEGKDADAIATFAEHLRAHKGDPENITSVSIDMSPAFIKGVTDNLPNARITFDKFHVIAHASNAVSNMRRVEQRTDPALKGLRWTLLKDKSSSPAIRPRTSTSWSRNSPPSARRVRGSIANNCATFSITPLARLKFSKTKGPHRVLLAGTGSRRRAQSALSGAGQCQSAQTLDPDLELDETPFRTLPPRTAEPGSMKTKSST
jgi:transposase